MPHQHRSGARRIPALRAFAVPVAAALLLCGVTADAARQQQLPHDPQLLEKLYRGDFDGIDRTRNALADVLMVMTAFSTVDCGSESSDPELQAAAQRAVSFVLSLPSTDLALTVAVGAGTLANPNYKRVTALVGQHGCSSERPQTTLDNLIRLLSSRSMPSAWMQQGRGLRSEPARPVPVPAPTRPPPPRPAPTGTALQQSWPAMTNEQAAQWQARCESDAGPAHVPPPARPSWCGCVQKHLTTVSPNQREDLLRDFRPTLREVERQNRSTARFLDRCDTAYSGVRRERRR